MNPMVSIIVPVYNGENYLPRCIESIINQDYPDFELLLADDGSTDGSGKICDGYAARDSRIRVIHKENSGVSDTRNRAIRLAKGEYLQFVDCDDWLSPDATRLLVRAAREQNCDMVISDFYRVVGERVSQKGDIDEERVLSREEFASFMMENPADFYYGVLWNKLYRRDLIEQHHLRMNPDISWCEDFLFNLEYIRWAERFYALRTPVYYYVKRKGSLASQGMNISKAVKMKLTLFEYYNNFYKHVLEEEEYEKNRLQVYRFLIDAASDGILGPAILSGAKRLGDERGQVCPEAVLEDGTMMQRYRDRKLFEHYLEPASLRYNLTFNELCLFLYLIEGPRVTTRRRLADLCHITRAGVSMSLQKLSARGYIRVEELKGAGEKKRQICISLLPAAEAILAELETAEADCRSVRFQGFAEEEIRQYLAMESRIQENTRKILLSCSGEQPSM